MGILRKLFHTALIGCFMAGLSACAADRAPDYEEADPQMERPPAMESPAEGEAGSLGTQ